MTNRLFSISADAKTIKGQKLGYLTGIMYLAPAKLSGFQVCPLAAAAGCEAPCLNGAGLAGVYSSIQNARIAKTRRYFLDRENFMRDVACSVAQLIESAVILGAVPLVRLNGTSDIRWELTPVDIDEKTAAFILKRCGFEVTPGVYSNIMEVFPEIQFYDYTKIPNRRNMPANYDLTFSYSGVVSFQRYATAAIESGARVAAVFRKQSEIPATFKGLPCIDGDNTDVRHIEPRGVIVALYAKGPARKDRSGFVIDAATV